MECIPLNIVGVSVKMNIIHKKLDPYPSLSSASSSGSVSFILPLSLPPLAGMFSLEIIRRYIISYFWKASIDKFVVIIINVFLYATFIKYDFEKSYKPFNFLIKSIRKYEEEIINDYIRCNVDHTINTINSRSFFNHKIN